jgi:hypothetical protein
MAGLEATLVIGAKDETGATLAALQKTVEAIDRAFAAVDKLAAATAKAARANDPLIASLAATQKAVAEQREGLASLTVGLEGVAGPTDGAAAAQAKLMGAIERTTLAMTEQGNAALRAAEKVANAQRRQGGAVAGFRKTVVENLPFLGPGILHETKAAAEAGGSVQDEIAALTAAGATPDQIAKARADFVGFSRKYAGVSEADWLAAYKDARVIAPAEPYEMTELGMRYRVAARNSGVPTSEADVSNVLRIMDELGLKTMPEREHLLDSILKQQQAFGPQISTETMLAAYRNAKQSIYDWSPEFREKLFPTLLQSSGQQGGTEMMTAFNNYIGDHMSAAELKTLINAGFAAPGDVTWDHNHAMVRPGAHLFESDVFEKNIAQWAWDFHDKYMSGKGATEGGFTDVIAKMPRNMAALIAFLVHNEARLKRDEATLGLPVGLAAGDNSYLAQNPGAGLDALKTSITQFAAAVSSPPMAEIGAGLQAFARGIQSVSASYEEFADKHPEAAKATGAAALAAGAATGGWLSWKLFTGIGRLFGFGGAGAATEAATAAETGALSLGGATGVGAAVLATGAALATLLKELGPEGPLGRFYSAPSPNDFPTPGELERSRRSGMVWHGGSFVYDPEAHRGEAMHRLMEDHGPLKVELDPTSKAQVSVDVTVHASDDLVRAVAAAKAASAGNLDAYVGRMDTDAAPRRVGGIGHM